MIKKLSFILCLFLVFCVYGEEIESTKNVQTGENSKIDYMHTKISTGILSFSQGIDNFFSSNEYSEIKNTSKLVIDIRTHFREAAGPYILPEVNYRLVLPRTQKSLQIFVESEDKDERSDTTATRENSIENQNQVLTASALGLGVIKKKFGFRLNSGMGLIFSFPTRSFIRAGAKKDIKFSKWLLKIDKRIKWVSDQGITIRSNFDFDRRLNESLLFRWVNQTVWNNQNYIVEFENGPTLFKQLNPKTVVSYAAHTITVNQPEQMVSNYILQIDYKKNIYKDWLFISYIPFVTFPREENFHRQPGFILKLQSVFGHI